MMILPPNTARPGTSSVRVPPEKLLPAVAFDLLMVGLGLYAFLETDQPLWMVAMALLGGAPLVWVVLSAAREQQKTGESRPIVEDMRRNR